MAFLKYARAQVVKSLSHERKWDKVRVAASGDELSVNLIEQASDILRENFDPRNYLLTHSTIVASTGLEAPPNVELGRIKFGSRWITRKYPEFYIKPECEKNVNNNKDLWSHPVVRKSYKTFIGAHNWVEHVQLEELSKGRVLDAVAREVEGGNSIYVDILVATHRKHDDLIRQIQSGELSTLSMGCFLPGTQITMADGACLPIEEVQPGDLVITHKGRPREVTNIQLRKGLWDLCQVYIEGKSDYLSVTGNHPFFVSTGTEIVEIPAEELLPGQFLFTPSANGFEKLHRVAYVEKGKLNAWVHNFEVEEDHSYLAGGIAVHNCSVDETTCTKCGHVAADETQMCVCIRFERGNHFYDSNGVRRLIAESCGHQSLDPTAGVYFIDASWVKVPAFTGAVLRNIVEPMSITPEMAKQAQQILSTPPSQWTSSGMDAFMKAASIASSYKFSQFGEPEGEEGGGEKEPDKPLEGLKNEIYDFITEEVKKQIKQDMKGEPKTDDKSEKGSMDPNESVVKEALHKKAMDTYKIGVSALIRTASNKVDFLRSLSRYNELFQIRVPKRLYMASLKLGSSSRYGSLDQYLASCYKVLGRKPSLEEAKTLVRLGQLLSNLETVR